jgi:hypothetical protein
VGWRACVAQARHAASYNLKNDLQQMWGNLEALTLEAKSAKRRKIATQMARQSC